MVSKMTKTQARRMAMSIKSKAARLFTNNIGNNAMGANLTVKEYNDIHKICNRVINKLK